MVGSYTSLSVCPSVLGQKFRLDDNSYLESIAPRVMKFGQNMDIGDPKVDLTGQGRSRSKVEVKGQGHQVKKAQVQFQFDCLAGHLVKVKGHMGPGQGSRGSRSKVTPRLVKIRLKLRILAGWPTSTASCFILFLHI